MNKDACLRKMDNETAVRAACGRELRKKRLLNDVLMDDFLESREKDLLVLCVRELAVKRRRRRVRTAAVLSLAASAVLVAGILLWRIGNINGPLENATVKDNPFQPDMKHPSAGADRGLKTVLSGGAGLKFELAGNRPPKYEAIGSNAVVARIATSFPTEEYYVQTGNATNRFAIVDNIPFVERTPDYAMPPNLMATRKDLLEFGRGRLALIGFGPDEKSCGRIVVFNKARFN